MSPWKALYCSLKIFWPATKSKAIILASQPHQYDLVEAKSAVKQFSEICMRAGATGWESDSGHQSLSSRRREGLVRDRCHWIANLCRPGKVNTTSADFSWAHLRYWVCTGSSSLCMFDPSGMGAEARARSSARACKAHVKVESLHSPCIVSFVFPHIYIYYG